MYDLAAEVDSLKSSALIEDFFHIRSTDLNISANSAIVLISEFCLEGDTVFDFSMQATFATNVSGVMVLLELNGVTMAQS